MIERLQNLLTEKFSYTLKDYALFELKKEAGGFKKITLLLFLVLVVLFGLDFSEIFENFVSLWVLILGFVVLVLLPLMMSKSSAYEAVIVTPKYLIQATSRTEFNVVEFDKVNRFKLGNDGILVQDSNASILLGLHLSRNEIDPIIDILEAKGKTFNPEKEYMVRPIEIQIINNKIQLIDIEVKSETDMIYEKFVDDFESLTPGYLDSILFHNSAVEHVEIFDKNIAFYFSSFDVKEGHPENTKFNKIVALDCVVVFANTTVKRAVLKHMNSDEPDETLEARPGVCKQYLENAVVSDWKVVGKGIEFTYASGVHVVNMVLAFDEVIIGWNETKE